MNISVSGDFMNWQSARWIWLEGEENKECRHVVFQRDFRLDELPVAAVLYLSADSSYRLRINGQWSADGPARFFSDSCFFDTVDCSHLLRCGLNRLESDVLFSGANTAGCGGFIALLEMTFADGSTDIIATDPSWRAAAIPQYVAGETEVFDNSIQSAPVFAPAQVVSDADGSVWQKLVPRPTPMLTRREALIRRVKEVKIISEDGRSLTAPAGTVENIQHLVYPDDRCAVIHPIEGFNLQLCCDGGVENTGFWNFVLCSPAGTVIEISVDGSEGKHPLRYICREGWNRYTATVRSRGRYVFVTFRNMTGDIRFQSLRLVESTYPLIPCGEFRSSDRIFDEIYEENLHQLKLSMLDVFSGKNDFSAENCRNEVLFALSCCGAEDLAGHSIAFAFDRILAGDGLFSVSDFLPVFSLADIFRELGTLEFCQRLYPQVVRLLERAKTQIDPASGLLKNASGGSDTNSNLLFKGALDWAWTLGDTAGVQGINWMKETAQNLSSSILSLWDDRHLSYCTGQDEKQEHIPVFSVLSSVLALLFDVIPENRRSSVCANIISPHSELEKVSGCSGTLFLLEALEKLGMPDLMTERIRSEKSVSESGSAFSLYTFPLVLLGLKNNGRSLSFTVSPFVNDLEYASGTRWTPCGPVHVKWRKTSEQTLVIDCCAPAGVTLQYQENVSLREYNVEFNCLESEEV